jgi:hypothetical protein
MGILNSETDRLRKRVADLEDALQKFIDAMDMHLGTAHETALCAAKDNARDLLAVSRGTRRG